MNHVRTLLLSITLVMALAAAPWALPDSSGHYGMTPDVDEGTIAPFTDADSALVAEMASEPPDPVSEELRQARELLEVFQREYRLLDGVTVEIGPTPDDHQAVAYYRSGRIVISPARQASLERIIEHEIWHIIDWRDTGSIDWGEDVPPANWSDYLLSP